MRHLVPASLFLVALTNAGCFNVRGSSSASSLEPVAVSTVAPGTTHEITRQELQARLMGYADRYLNRMSEATDMLEAMHPTAQCRVMAHSTKFYPSLSVITLASEPEPQIALLDLLVVVTLERMVWEGGWSSEQFGAHAHILLDAQRDMERDLWSLASTVMSEQQMTELRELIEQWRRDNPNRKYVSSTRFDDFAAMRAQQDDSSLRGGLFLAPVSEAARTVEETRLLGERILFIASRMPLLLQWQSELMMNQLAAKEEVQQLLADSGTLTDAAQRLAYTMERLPDELHAQREALLRDLESHQETAGKIMSDLRGSIEGARELADRVEQINRESSPVIAQCRELVTAVDQTLVSADALAVRLDTWRGPDGEPRRPFDIREYTDAATALNVALQELNKALTSTDELLVTSDQAGAFQHLDAIVARGMDRMGENASQTIDTLFWRGVALVGVGAVTVALLMFVRRAVHGRMGAPRRTG